MSKPRAFLICPVRGQDPETIRPYVERLEAEGWEVHWPARDTDQNDTVGLRILHDNLDAIRAADRVFFIWNGKSEGALFDLGATLMAGKPLTVLDAPDATDGKSFQNAARAYATPATEVSDETPGYSGLVDLTHDPVWRRALLKLTYLAFASIRSEAWATPSNVDLKLIESLSDFAHNLPLFLSRRAGENPDPRRFDPRRLAFQISSIEPSTPHRQHVRDQLLHALPDTAHKKAALLADAD